MDIQSTLLIPAGSAHLLPIFHTEVTRSGETISVIATIILGCASEHQILPTAQECLEQFISVQATACPDAIVHLVDLVSVEEVAGKIEEALLKAHRGDAIVYLCKTPEILEETLVFVGLETRPDVFTWPMR